MLNATFRTTLLLLAVSLAICEPVAAQRELPDYLKKDVMVELSAEQFGMEGWIQTASLTFLDEGVQLSEIVLFDEAPAVDLTRAAVLRAAPLIRSALNVFGAVSARHMLKPYPNEVLDFTTAYRITFATERGARAFVAFINNLTHARNAGVSYDMEASVR